MDDLSQFEQCRRQHPGATDEECVRHLAEGIIENLALEPPINLDVVASFQGVARVEVEDMPWAGCLTTEGDEVVIRVRVGDGWGRRRFTVPHEVCHTFFPGYRLEQHYRCSPNPASSLSRGRDVEWLCDVGAGELLLPSRHFYPDVRAARFGLDIVEELAQRYDASLEATAHRYVEVSASDLLLMVLEPMLKPVERGARSAEPALRVASVHSNGDWPFIPRYKSSPVDGPLGRALEGEIVHERTDIEGLSRSTIEDVELSARLYPYVDDDGNDHRRIIALLRSTR